MAAVALGKSMAEAVFSQQHLWQMVMELPETLNFSTKQNPPDCLDRLRREFRPAAVRGRGKRWRCGLNYFVPKQEVAPKSSHAVRELKLIKLTVN